MCHPVPNHRVPQPPSPTDTPVPTAAAPTKQDGRKRRWHEHKIARREELVDGTIKVGRDVVDLLVDWGSFGSPVPRTAM